MEGSKKVVMVLIDKDNPGRFLFVTSRGEHEEDNGMDQVPWIVTGGATNKVTVNENDKTHVRMGKRKTEDEPMALSVEDESIKMKPVQTINHGGPVKSAKRNDSLGKAKDENIIDLTVDGTVDQHKKRCTRRESIPWTAVEINAVRTGVNLFGEGKWISIKKHYNEELKRRTNVDIKDCYRRL
jgi:hypothetical protein